MRLMILFFTLLSSFSLLADAPAKLQKYSLVQDCTILDISGKVKRVFPGKMCLFLDDGRFVSANENFIRLYGKKKEPLWTLPGHYHHQLALSLDKKKILAIASSYLTIKGEKIREDLFQVISLEGKILAEERTSKILTDAKLPFLFWVNSPWLVQETSTKKEISHFNSFYEIPANESGLSYLQQGNFVINGLSHGIFVLTSDLKKTLHHEILPTSINHFVHDVQVTKEGNIIYFNNFSKEGGEDLNSFSTIHEYDLKKKQTVFEFKANPETTFFSRYCGSVQELDDGLLLFSDKFNGTWIYSRNDKKLLLTIRGTHFQNKLPVYNQTTKGFDLSAFFKNSL